MVMYKELKHDRNYKDIKKHGGKHPQNFKHLEYFTYF